MKLDRHGELKRIKCPETAVDSVAQNQLLCT